MLQKATYRQQDPTDIAPQVILTDAEHLTFVLTEFGAYDLAAMFRREGRRITHFLNEWSLPIPPRGDIRVGNFPE